ncbi:MAG: Dihydrolipoyl dehydrogenase [Verrucomicrobia subdivision 3 bacterium]|nr:Dihydrolipoyl dehydrogenase [Limisphaerales bacterium]
MPSLDFDGEVIISSTEALALNSVPEHLVVIGAGYIGLEMGSVWSRLGAQVTVIEALDRILPGMDQDLASESQKLFTKQGLRFKLSTQFTNVTSENGAATVHLDSGESLQGDKVLVAVGRKPNTAELGLEALGVMLDDRGGIRVDSHFATNIPGVFALGDVIGGPMLAHKAEAEGVVFAESLVNGRGHVNYDAIPGVVYTHPEIAAVGKTEQQLTDNGAPFRRGVFTYRANGRARAADQNDGFAKLLVDKESSLILGAHILGANAGELINEVTLAMNAGRTADDLSRSCHAHPTFGEVLKEAALAACGRGLHN